MSRRMIVASLLSLASLGAVPATAGGQAPALAYFTDVGIDVTTIDGTVLSSYGPVFQFMSLDGNIFAASRHTRDSEAIITFVATTHERLYRIRDAFAPVVMDDGHKVGFLPDRFGNRDPFFATVWRRTPSGRERPVVRFYGPRSTVPGNVFDGDGIPLEQAWDAAGRMLAVTFGNDIDLFIYDVWVVDARTREATRVSRGRVSRFPSLSPSGAKLALVREVELCGGEGPGRRASDLRVMDSDGTDRVTLLQGTCDLYYTDPRWISEAELAAGRLTRLPSGDYDIDLVRVDATTGVVTDLVATGDVSYFSVSAELQKIVYHRASDPTGFSIYDLALGTSTDLPAGDVPHILGEHRLI
jgi:hypothetical protein